MWARTFERFLPAVMSARLMQVAGDVQKSPEGVIHLMAHRIIDLDQPSCNIVRCPSDRSGNRPGRRVFAHPQPPRHVRAGGHPRNVRTFPEIARFSLKHCNPSVVRYRLRKASQRRGKGQMGEREMILIARILAALAALFGIVLGLGFLIDPIKSGANFFLSPNGIPGMAVLRADMCAFFLTGGSWSLPLPGARMQALIAPILLFAIAITGRTVSLIVDGVTPGAFVPMAVEAFFVSQSSVRAPHLCSEQVKRLTPARSWNKHKQHGAFT